MLGRILITGPCGNLESICIIHLEFQAWFWVLAYFQRAMVRSIAVPRHWQVCGVCMFPVRRRCYVRNWVPEREHMGGNLNASVHHQALPTVCEVQKLPALQHLIPEEKASRPVSDTKKAKMAKKTPAAGKRVGSTVKKSVRCMWRSSLRQLRSVSLQPWPENQGRRRRSNVICR